MKRRPERMSPASAPARQVETPLRFLYRLAIRRPLPTLLAGVIPVLAAAPGLTRLTLRTDGHALVPEHAPAIREDRRIRDIFHVEDLFVVLIRTDDQRGLYNPKILKLVQRLTDALKALPGVHPWNVMSLATERTDRTKPGTLIFRRFLEPLPCTDNQLETLRGDLAAIRLYNGTLVSDDGFATAILVGAPSGMDRMRLYRRIVALTQQYRTRWEEHIDVIGAPVAEALLGTHILQDLGVPERFLPAPLPQDEPAFDRPATLHEWRVFIARHVGLVPVALVLMALVFLISFRSA
ncbi:MAG: hypothetical protein D6788_02135, partial [Planctomycetota bacterium]